MPIIELNDRFVKTVKSDGRRVEYFDALTKGLSLLVSTRTKTWFSHYTADRTRRRIKLGPYPELSLASAREKARKTRAKVIDGIDPVVEKRTQVQQEKSSDASLVVADLVESYIVRHVSKTRQFKETTRRIKRDILPLIGDVTLADLHRRDITRVLDTVIDRGSPATANRLFDDIRAMIRWAKARGDLDENIVDGMQHPAPKIERDRLLSADEICTMWTMLDSADMWDVTKRIIRLCLVTAQRVGEISGMARGELDLEARTWTLPAERVKNDREHVVPLSELANGIIREQLKALEALCRRKGRTVPEFVFPSPGGRAAISRAAAGRAIKRHNSDGLTLGIRPWTPHDLRRTAATHMEELGVSPVVVGHILNHASITRASVTSRVYARYNYASEKRAALELWSDQLQMIIDGKGKVVPLTTGESR